MKREIVTYGDPRLREKALPVDTVDDTVRRLVKDLLDTMYAAAGIGLAAQQIAERIAVAVVDVPPELDVSEQGGPRLNPGVRMPLVLINPEITETEGTETANEGCLSFPEFFVPVKRPARITVSGLDMNGDPRTFNVTALAARAVQHEMDHLNAVLLVDRMSRIKRITRAGDLKRIRKNTLDGLV